MNANHLSKLLLSCSVALGALAMPPPSAAQATQVEQVRAIEQEYARLHGGRDIPDEQLEYYLDRRSRGGWDMERIRSDMADARRGTNDQNWRPADGWSATGVVCSSTGNRYRECAVPFRGRAVVSEQLSQSACVEGRGWGQKPGLVWVDHGCRARFTMMADDAYGQEDRRSVVCKSRNGARAVCNTGIDGRVRLLSRFKNSEACVEGRTWGQRANQVWVSGNCRARFVAASYPRRNNNYQDRFRRDPAYSVTCSSESSRQERCDWDDRYGAPRLDQLLSRAQCVQGRSWGYSQRDGLWVNGGCRARFAAR